jgi:hypothetical protein
MAKRFNGAGIPARAVPADTGREERDESLRLLRQREIGALYAWAAHQGAAIDLIVRRGSRLTTRQPLCLAAARLAAQREQPLRP